MIIVNLISLCIFIYVVGVKIDDMLHHKKDENTFYRVLFTLFIVVLAIDATCLVAETWRLISYTLFKKILSGSFLVFALISLKVNTRFFEKITNRK